MPKLQSIALLLAMCVTLLCSEHLSGQNADSPDTQSQSEQRPPTPMVLMRGADVAVRAVGESKLTADTPRVGIEAFRDVDFGTLAYVTDSGAVATMRQPSNFELRYVALDGFYELVRFQPRTGRAWRLDHRKKTWQPIVDTEPLARGDYDIVIVPVSNEMISVLRIETLGGTTWTMKGSRGKPDTWEAVSEPK